MFGYGKGGLISEENSSNKMFLYLGSFFVVVMGLCGFLILLFVLSGLNYFY
jgi:hypothetical protein